MTDVDVHLVVTDLGAGLWLVECHACGQTRRAVGRERAVDAVKAEHQCGGADWHLGPDRSAPAG